MAKKVNDKLGYIDPKEEPFSPSSINRFDIYSLKGALDDEIISVCTVLLFVKLLSFSGWKAILLLSIQTTSTLRSSYTR